MKRECPRCKNEQISANANYCEICGLDLRKESTAPEGPVQEQSKEIVLQIDGEEIARIIS